MDDFTTGRFSSALQLDPHGPTLLPIRWWFCATSLRRTCATSCTSCTTARLRSSKQTSTLSSRSPSASVSAASVRAAERRLPLLPRRRQGRRGLRLPTRSIGGGARARRLRLLRRNKFRRGKGGAVLVRSITPIKVLYLQGLGGTSSQYFCRSCQWPRQEAETGGDGPLLSLRWARAGGERRDGAGVGSRSRGTPR